MTTIIFSPLKQIIISDVLFIKPDNQQSSPPPESTLQGPGTFKLSQTLISIRFHFCFGLLFLEAYSAKKILIEIRKISLSKSYFLSLTSRPIYFQSIDDFGILELKNWISLAIKVVEDRFCLNQFKLTGGGWLAVSWLIPIKTNIRSQSELSSEEPTDRFTHDDSIWRWQERHFPG